MDTFVQGDFCMGRNDGQFLLNNGGKGGRHQSEKMPVSATYSLNGSLHGLEIPLILWGAWGLFNKVIGKVIGKLIWISTHSIQIRIQRRIINKQKTDL